MAEIIQEKMSIYEKLQIPALLQLPIPVPSPFLSTPLEVHATSYFAASVRI